MGQFKPMVKMFTDEPSVILKLKKGGKVQAKGQAEGFKSMASSNKHDVFESAEHGAAPKKPSMSARRKAMNPNQYAKGGKVAHKQLGGVMPMAAPAVAPTGRTGGLNPAAGSMANPMAARALRAAVARRALTSLKSGGKASGKAIDAAETKTTIKGGVSKFDKTKMDASHKDRAHGTGDVKEGKPGGYKMGGTIEGNEGKFKNTKVVDGSKTDKAHGTGGIKVANAGGFKKGGKVPGLGNAIEGGDWENRAADTAKPGVKNTRTGEVKEANAGGYKRGGSAKKHFATGGNVVDNGKAEKMPRHFVSRPVANSLQSGTFKKGGKVKKFDDGGSTGDPVIDRETRRMKAEQNAERAENEGLRDSILGAPTRAFNAVKNLFSSSEKPAGSVTKTERSVTVTPKKRGGKC